MMNQLNWPIPRIQPVNFPNQPLAVEVLRLDEIHPVVSGNKWYKLKEYLADAISLNKKTILTFGGAYSNHIVATAAACRLAALQSIGVIRGEKPASVSHTLLQAMEYGMKLFFTTREAYRTKQVPDAVFHDFSKEEIYVINEGGYGKKGMEGARTILDNIPKNYTHVIAAVGTGTTLAGLIAASQKNQSVIGISVLKNNFSLQNEIETLLPEEKKFSLFHEFHFGGYAKRDQALIDFMNDCYQKTGIPTDFVYTGKLFFALNQLIDQHYFTANSQLLVVHSGGLQGNESLPNGMLAF